MKKDLTFIAVSVIVIALMSSIGFVEPSSTYAQNNSNQYVTQAFNSKPATFRLTLNALLEEHTVLAVTMLKGIYTGEDTSRLQQLMNTNQSQLAVLVQKAYGNKAASSFNTLWSAHMQEYMNYTSAKRNNDTAGMNNARKNLQTISDKLGTLLQMQDLSANTISTLMMQHVDGTLSFVDAVAKNDMTQQANLMHQGSKQANTFADTMSKGILLDKPQLFK